MKTKLLMIMTGKRKLTVIWFVTARLMMLALLSVVSLPQETAVAMAQIENNAEDSTIVTVVEINLVR